MDYTIQNPPPEGKAVVGEFVQTLFEESFETKENLNLPDRWFFADQLFKGDHWRLGQGNAKKNTSIRRAVYNLLFANIQRTVANITARSPVAEVVEVGGEGDEVDSVLTDMIKTWNNESEHGRNLTRSVTKMEINGITVEKAVYNEKTGLADIVVMNPYGFFPAPGFYEDCNAMPYIIHAHAMDVSEIAEKYGVKEEDVETEDLYSIMGEDREENAILRAGMRSDSGNYPGNYSDNLQSFSAGKEGYRDRRALVLECWLRDWTTEDVDTGEVDEEGKPIMQYAYVYPGGIRVITTCNKGKMVLSDIPNPNINEAVGREATSKTYLYDHFPFWYANSFDAQEDIWGMTALEMTADINREINRLLTRLGQYLDLTLFPPLICPEDTGLTRFDFSNKPGLFVQPTSGATATGIRYLQVPSLPADFWRTLDWLVSMFDRIYQIEDADRGEAPNGVIAAAAIQALQERGAVMMRAKIRAVDYLVRQRGRAAISFLQNFGTSPQKVDHEGQPAEIVGVNLLGREFVYIVESGSTVHRTTMQTQEQAVQLYDKGAIDRQALLETLNFPGWKQIVERVGEGQLAQAIQILIQAGLDEQSAAKLKAYLEQPQTGYEATQQNGEAAMAGGM